MPNIKSRTRIRFSIFRALRTEGHTVQQAWKAADEAILFMEAGYRGMQAMDKLGYEKIRFWKPKVK